MSAKIQETQSETPSQGSHENSSTADLSPQQKAAVLIETLPWLRKYAGTRIVVKYGGNAMVDPELQKAFAQDIVFLRQWGIEPIVVHGGGPQISQMLDDLGLEAEFKGGMRVTTTETMEVVRMVLTGRVQRELVSLINAQAIRAVGMSGEDAGMFHARKTTTQINGEDVDLGHVGEIIHVNPKPILDLINAGHIPVISSIAVDKDNPEQVLNINADLAAAHVAMAVGAHKLMVLTNVKGIYRNYPDPTSLIRQLKLRDAHELLQHVDTGMKPKLTACIEAIEGGVKQATIIDGRTPHEMLLEVFTDDGVGTMLIPDALDGTTDDVLHNAMDTAGSIGTASTSHAPSTNLASLSKSVTEGGKPISHTGGYSS